MLQDLFADVEKQGVVSGRCLSATLCTTLLAAYLIHDLVRLLRSLPVLGKEKKKSRGRVEGESFSMCFVDADVRER